MSAIWTRQYQTVASRFSLLFFVVFREGNSAVTGLTRHVPVTPHCSRWLDSFSFIIWTGGVLPKLMGCTMTRSKVTGAGPGLSLLTQLYSPSSPCCTLRNTRSSPPATPGSLCTRSCGARDTACVAGAAPGPGGRCRQERDEGGPPPQLMYHELPRPACRITFTSLGCRYSWSAASRAATTPFLI